MKKKRYKKLLMSVRIPRNIAEDATQWGRQHGMQLRRDHLDEDSMVLAFAFDADLFGVQMLRERMQDVLDFFPGLNKALELAGENLPLAVSLVRCALSEAGDGHA